MSENSLKCRNKFFNKVLNKISALKDDFDLLHKVDRKIYRNISRNISSQVGGVHPSFVEKQLAQFYLTKDIEDLQNRLTVDFEKQMQDIINDHTMYITNTDNTVKKIGTTHKIDPLFLTNEELDVYMNIIIPFNIPRDLLPELFKQKVTKETHVKYYNEYCTRHQIKVNHNIPVKSIDSILTHINNDYNNFNENANNLYKMEIDGLQKKSNTNIWEYIFEKLLTIYGNSEENKELINKLSEHMMILYYYMVGKKIKVPDTSVLMNQQMQEQFDAQTQNRDRDPLSHIIKAAIAILDAEVGAPVVMLNHD